MLSKDMMIVQPVGNKSFSQQLHLENCELYCYLPFTIKQIAISTVTWSVTLTPRAPPCDAHDRTPRRAGRRAHPSLSRISEESHQRDPSGNLRPQMVVCWQMIGPDRRSRCYQCNRRSCATNLCVFDLGFRRPGQDQGSRTEDPGAVATEPAQ